MRLTERIIDSLTCPPGKKDCLKTDATQQGLYVRVDRTGSKSYLVQYTLAGQKTRVPLGSRDALTLKAARTAAATIMGNRAIGIDTAAERKRDAATARAKAATAQLTVARLIDGWHDLHLASRRPRYAAEAVRALRYGFAKHLSLPAEALDRRAVVAVLDGMQRAGSQQMAARTGAYGRAAFRWALRRGMITTNPFAELPTIPPARARERVLSDEEVGRVWRAAEAMPGPFGRIVRLLILTGARKGEVAEMPWSELSEDRSTWTIHSARTKNHLSHIVPLSHAARAIIRECPHLEGELVFPGERAGQPVNSWSKSQARLIATSGVTGWVLHDLRRSAATGLQRLGVRLEVTEGILNHTGSRAGIVGVYQKHDFADEKAAALNAWARHVAEVVAARNLTREYNR